jgi:hypothetical protein
LEWDKGIEPGLFKFKSTRSSGRNLPTTTEAQILATAVWHARANPGDWTQVLKYQWFKAEKNTGHENIQ